MYYVDERTEHEKRVISPLVLVCNEDFMGYNLVYMLLIHSSAYFFRMAILPRRQAGATFHYILIADEEETGKNRHRNTYN